MIWAYQQQRQLGSTRKTSNKSNRRREKVSRKAAVDTCKRLHKSAFGSAIRRPIRAELLKAGGRKIAEKSILKSSKIAITAARKSVKAAGVKGKVRTSRIIPIPKTGRVLPLIPIFAGLSALGSIAGGVAGIVRTIKAVKSGNAERIGATLHLCSKGSGLYLKPYGFKYNGLRYGTNYE